MKVNLLTSMKTSAQRDASKRDGRVVMRRHVERREAARPTFVGKAEMNMPMYGTRSPTNRRR